MRPRVIVEDRIPFIKGVLETVADVVYLPSAQIDAAAMKDADALVTRTRTRCDASLLDGSRCRFIATATIGTDHIDLEYCRNHGVDVANAPGCNAPGVGQYVCRALLEIYGKERLQGMTLGVVGVGNVGKIVERWARGLGMHTLLCDPPRAEKEGGAGFVTLDEIYDRADVITFHTPLTRSGEYPTYHLFDADVLSKLGRKPVIINAARGAVVDNRALLAALESGAVSGAVIDCWEEEPDIDRRLLDRCEIATPHIAGYSREGKIRATVMAVEAVCDHFGFPYPLWDEKPGPVPETVTAEAVMSSYDIMADTAALKSAPENFETLRNSYNFRPEPRN